MKQIKNYFDGAGKIYKQGSEFAQYTVYSIEDLQIILNHFDKYPLITQKWFDYQIFLGKPLI